MKTQPRITILKSKFQELHDWLISHPRRHERAAILFFRKFNRGTFDATNSPRYVLIDSFKLDDDWILSSSETHVEIKLTKLVEAYYKCETENLCLGFIHTHPTGFEDFSAQDDIHERNIYLGLTACNGGDSEFLSIISCDGSLKARVYRQDEKEYARHVCVIGESLDIFLNNKDQDESSHLKRQAAAFGPPFNLKMNSLRATVVGVGGTGSPLATLLARSGIGELILIDGDKLEDSNMNRVRGYNSNDVGRYKAESLAKYIEALGLKTKVKYVSSTLEDSSEAIDLISSSDIIFGCTDDNLGRSLLLEAAYYYGLIYIDVGLTGFIGEDLKHEPILRDHRGRISLILPEHGSCLYCQRVINQNKIDFEIAVKENPSLRELPKEQLEKDYYLRGGGVQAPGVGPFTSMTADFGLATLMNLIKEYRKISEDMRSDNTWIDYINLQIYSNEPEDNPDCPFCRMGSLTLLDEKGYRLGMPKLGKYK